MSKTVSLRLLMTPPVNLPDLSRSILEIGLSGFGVDVWEEKSDITLSVSTVIEAHDLTFMQLSLVLHALEVLFGSWREVEFVSAKHVPL